MSTPTTPSGAAGDPSVAAEPEAEALQTALAAEHAAVFVYAALGAQTSRSGTPALFGRLTRAYRVHLNRRDRLRAMLEDLGATPVAAEPGYELPADLGNTAALTQRALALEEGAASTYAFVVASTSGEQRTWAIEALLDASVRGLGFGGRPRRLPGI